MVEIEYVAGYVLGAIALDNLSLPSFLKKTLNLSLIILGLIFAQVHIFTSLPILFCSLIYLFNEKTSVNGIKILTLIVVLFSSIDETYWKFLLVLMLYGSTQMSNLNKGKRISLSIINYIYTFAFFLVGVWLFYINGNIDSKIYANFQLPIAISMFIVCIARSYNILDSVKAMNIYESFQSNEEKYVTLMINKFYIPIFILDIIKANIGVIDAESTKLLTLFVSIIIIASLLKQFYEIKYIGRKVSSITLIFNYFCAVFVFTNIFVPIEYFTQLIGAIVYIILVYSVINLIQNSTYEPRLKPILILLFLPTPLSLTFYLAIQAYNLLTMSNFPLMATTFILIIVFSFLLKVDLLGNKLNSYDKISNKA